MTRGARIGLGFVFLWFSIGGIAHFAPTDLEMRIVPPYVPAPCITVTPAWSSSVPKRLVAARLRG